MPYATASHILVAKQERAEEIKQRLDSGEDFAALARQYSLCPSSARGGDLGRFSKGDMVPEFDQVVFAEEVGQAHGPVKTQFGYHLILITGREE